MFIKAVQHLQVLDNYRGEVHDFRWTFSSAWLNVWDEEDTWPLIFVEPVFDKSDFRTEVQPAEHILLVYANQTFHCWRAWWFRIQWKKNRIIPWEPTKMLNSSWKVNVSSFTGRLLAASPNIHPRPQRFASPIVIIMLLLVSSFTFSPSSSMLVRCLHTETMIIVNNDQLKIFMATNGSIWPNQNGKSLGLHLQ